MSNLSGYSLLEKLAKGEPQRERIGMDNRDFFRIGGSSSGRITLDSVIDVLLGGQYPSFISVLHSSHGFQGDFLDSIYERTVEGESRMVRSAVCSSSALIPATVRSKVFSGSSSPRRGGSEPPNRPRG